MESAQVTVAYVNGPKGNAMSGNIKCTDGQYYGVPTESLGMFQPGQTYNITFLSKYHEASGRTYKNVKSVNGGPLTTGHPPVQPTPQTVTTPAGSVSSEAVAYGPPRKEKDTFPSIEEQFIKEVVGGACRAGTIDPRDFDALSVALNNARSVWKSYEDFGKPVYDGPQDPYDEIPL